jgi:hypothetical protein
MFCAYVADITTWSVSPGEVTDTVNGCWDPCGTVGVVGPTDTEKSPLTIRVPTAWLTTAPEVPVTVSWKVPTWAVLDANRVRVEGNDGDVYPEDGVNVAVTPVGSVDVTERDTCPVKLVGDATLSESVPIPEGATVTEVGPMKLIVNPDAVTVTDTATPLV